MLRPGRDPAEAERPDQLAHAALLVAHAEAALDQGAEIDQAPAHHPVLHELGAALQTTRQLALLLRVQPPLPAWRLAVEQTVRPGGVEAVHPSRPQRLPVHAAAAGRRGAACALEDQRDRQQPAGLFRRHRRLLGRPRGACQLRIAAAGADREQDPGRGEARSILEDAAANRNAIPLTPDGGHHEATAVVIDLILAGGNWSGSNEPVAAWAIAKGAYLSIGPFC